MHTYQRRRISRQCRRDFLRRVIALGGGLAMRHALFVAPAADDDAIVVRTVTFSGVDDVPLRGYLAQPARAGRVPGVVVLHDGRGLLPSIEEVARRFAGAGFAALAPDLLARTNGGGGSPDLVEIPRSLRQADARDHVEDTIAAGNFLRHQAGVRSEAHGVAGFGFGGDVAWSVAVSDALVGAIIAFDGAPPELEAAARMRAAALGFYGGQDTRSASGLADLEMALNMAGVPHALVVYPGVDRDFFDATGSRYAPIAAADAWSRTVDWMRNNLPAAEG